MTEFRWLTLSVLVPNTFVLPLSKTPVIPTRLPTSPPRLSTLLSAGLPHPVLGFHSTDGSLSGPTPASDVASDQSPPVAGVRSPDDSLSGPASGYDVAAVLSPPVAGVRSPDDSLSGPASGYDITAVPPLLSFSPYSDYLLPPNYLLSSTPSRR